MLTLIEQGEFTFEKWSAGFVCMWSSSRLGGLSFISSRISRSAEAEIDTQDQVNGKYVHIFPSGVSVSQANKI